MNPNEDKEYLKNFGMLIPRDVVRRDDGKPAIFARYKDEFIDYLKSEGHFDGLNEMTWAQRDEAYLKWEKEIKDKS